MIGRRVVVTGLGMVSPLGNTVVETWDNILAGKSGASLIETFDVSAYSTQFSASVKNLDISQYLEPKQARKLDMFVQYGMAAGIQAMEDSGIEVTEENAPRIGCSIGSGIGGIGEIEKNAGIISNSGPRRISPFFVPGSIINMISGNLSVRYNLQGPNLAIVTACTSGTHNIGMGARLIALGDADAMLVGGAEMATTPVGLIEEYEAAKARGANIYAELTGFGMSGDAHHMTLPPEDGRGAAASMHNAIRDAGIALEKINYINAHGTSTNAGDVAETRAIESVLGNAAADVAVSSTKSMIGHLLGAAGAVEAIFAILAMRDQVAPPTINLDQADEGCNLNYVPNTAQERAIHSVLSNSFGFGGTNGSLLFSKAD